MAQNSFATTHAFFGNPDKVTVIVQGLQNDTDAIALFNSLTITAVDDGSFYKKTLSYVTFTNEKVLELVCKISKTNSDFGSCTLVMYKSEVTAIGASSVVLGLQDRDAAKLQQEFASPGPLTGIIYKSQDGKLLIRMNSNPAAMPWFSVSYI